MISWLLLAGLAVIAATGAFAAKGGGRTAWTRRRDPPSDPPHRQAIHHFASGVLPPWR